MLPDSNTNEPMSHGFVTFSINRFPDLPIGTVLKNAAAIYFDFNYPIITNKISHTIVEPIVSNNFSTPLPSSTLTLIPNPANHSFSIASKHKLEEYTVVIFDLLGKQFLQKSTTKNIIDISTLPQGLYLVQVHAGGQFFTQKLIVQR